ncbi:MAG TPA: hypothetical protein VIJ25_05040, partial [Methylococcales bacterium]
MALAIDSSTPAPGIFIGTATSGTSASFSPPANSVIFAFFAMTGNVSASPQSVASITDSLGTHLQWNFYTGSRDNIAVGSTLTGTTEVWWASCPSAQTNMTVTSTFTTSNNGTGSQPGCIMQLIVFTGASPTQTGNASIRNSTSTGTPSQTLVTSAANSWVFGAIQSWTTFVSPTVGTAQTITFNGNVAFGGSTTNDSFWVQSKNATTSTSGTTVTINDTAPTGIVHHFSMVEVLETSINKISTLVDTFTGTVIDTVKWTIDAGVAGISQNDELIMPLPSNNGTYSHLTSVDLFDLSNSQIFVEVTGFVNVGQGAEMQLMLWIDNSNWIFIGFDGGTLVT